MQTNFATLSAGQKKVWESKVWEEFESEFIFTTNGMLSKGINDSGNIIHNVDGLTNPDGRGTRAVMPFVPNLIDDGTVGSNVLAGREEEMEAQWLEIQVDMLRHAVRRASEIKEQQTVIRFRMQAKSKLGQWLGRVHNELGMLTLSGVAYTSKLDGGIRNPDSMLPQLNFAASVSAPSSLRKFHAGAATSTATLTTSDVMAWNRLVEICAHAETQMLPPLRRGDGQPRFGVIMHSNQYRDLKKDPNFQAAAAQADTRGSNNMLWKGAVKVVDNIAIYSTPYAVTTYGAASGSKYGAAGTVDGAQAMLVGAQSLAWANIGSPDWKEDPQMDYGDKPGIAIKQMFGWRKAVWERPKQSATAQDWATVAFYTAAAQLS